MTLTLRYATEKEKRILKKRGEKKREVIKSMISMSNLMFLWIL